MINFACSENVNLSPFSNNLFVCVCDCFFIFYMEYILYIKFKMQTIMKLILSGIFSVGITNILYQVIIKPGKTSAGVAPAPVGKYCTAIVSV